MYLLIEWVPLKLRSYAIKPTSWLYNLPIACTITSVEINFISHKKNIR